MANEVSPLAALVWRERYRISGYLLSQHALSAGDAVAYRPQSPAAQAEFERMRRVGIVREAIQGHYWIDLPRFDAEVAARRSKASLIAIAVSLAIALGLMALFWL
jgi:hypothetical protein